MRVIASILLIFLTLTSCAKAINKSGEYGSSFYQLSGSYEITFSLVKEGQIITQTKGILSLVQTGENDTSPKTGEKPPVDEDLKKTPYYGWIEADFDKVNAPVFLDDEVAPPPFSKDPIYPGVLFHVLGQPLGGKTGAVLTVSTLSNLRTNNGWLDGAGIGLKIDEISRDSFSGRWDAWGIVHGGSGSFFAERIQTK